MCKKQEELYNRWLILEHRIKLLGSCVQNDLGRMFSDGYITLGDIKFSSEEFSTLYNKFIKDLEEIATETKNFIDDKYKELGGGV